MKKLIVSCLVSLVLIATMTVPAIAADTETEGSLGASVNVNEILSLTVVDNTPGTGISFGDLDEGDPDNPDLAQTDVLGAVTLEVGVETNVAVDLQTKGTGNESGCHYDNKAG